MNRSKILLSTSTLAGAAVGTVAAWATLPAGTPPVRSKHKGAQSIAGLEPIEIGGVKQWLLQRGADVANPILLFIHGGPGISQMVLNRANTAPLEQYFTVVNWDQRGAGKSHKAIHDKAGMNIPQFVSDLGEVAQHLLCKFGKQRLTLVGRSWGTAIGMLAVAKYPELFHAYVGIGQLTDVLESEKASYRWALEQALAAKDRDAIHELSEMGAPPYSGNWLEKFIAERKYICRYGGEVWGNSHGSNLKIARSVLWGQEYNIADRVSFFHVAKQSLRLLQPQLMKVNLFQEVPEVKVPIFFIAGRHDHVVPQSVAHRYYEALKAPHKEWHWFEESAHMPDFEEKEKFQKFLVERVRGLSV